MGTVTETNMHCIMAVNSMERSAAKRASMPDTLHITGTQVLIYGETVINALPSVNWNAHRNCYYIPAGYYYAIRFTPVPV
jgi:hypothetical protein